MQWFEEPGFQRGAFATLVGLALAGGPAEGTWEGLALGDSCLFHVRDDQLAEVFPIEDAEAFGSRPFLLASNPRLNDGFEAHSSNVSGTWKAGDRFYLMSDALAHWFVREHQAGNAPWRTLRQPRLARTDGFSEWVGELRSSRHIRNDDVTLLTVHID